jgi:hypothetical protein
MSDLSVLPFPPTFTYCGHIFVLEIQNISPAACSLQLPQVVLEPRSDTNNQPFYSVWRASDPGYKTQSQPRVLEPGAWAHLLFAWTSRAGPELSCDQYSGLRLRFTLQLGFARMSWELKADYDRPHLTEVIAPTLIFNRLHEALQAFEKRQHV